MAFKAEMLRADSGKEVADRERREYLTRLDKSLDEKLDVFTGILIRFDKLDEATGSFVAEMRLRDGDLPPPRTNGKPVTGNRFKVFGRSKGLAKGAMRRIGQEVECFGKWEDGETGPKFAANLINEKMPSSPEAIEALLGGGRLKGLGPAWARQIVEKFGTGTIEMLDLNPEKLLELSGFGEKRLADVKAGWEEMRPSYGVLAFARLHGIGESVADKLWQAFGSGARRTLEQNPYSMMKIPGIGFKTADKLARSLGVEAKAPFRIQSCIKHVLDEAGKNEGHLALPREELLSKVIDWLELDDGRAVEIQLDIAVANGGLVERSLTVKKLVGDRWKEKAVLVKARCYSTKAAAAAEERVARELFRLVSEGKGGARAGGVVENLRKMADGLDETQSEAAKNALMGSVSVITGGPGTGKTHTIKTILRVAELSGLTVRMCAPTGRAAKRIEESTGGEASTIHRMLGFSDKGFKFGEDNPLPGDLFIVDEASMVDIWLAQGLLKAIPSGASLVMVGDVDQLPSVGAGNVLHDMIASGTLPVSRLGQIHRQAAGSKIIGNAHKIIRNQYPDLCAETAGEDFAFIEAKGNDDILSSIEVLCSRLLANGVPGDSIQLLTPQRAGILGTDGLNEALRKVLNRNAKGGEEGWRVCRGDRVMQTRNNYDLDLFNGDVGTVMEMGKDGKSALVDFEGRGLWLTGAAMRDITPAFAMTIHKSQGTEHDHVIIPMTKSHSFMFSSNLLYTAVTRGKRKVFLVGEKQVVFDVARRAARQFRHTGLKESLPATFVGREPQPVRSPPPAAVMGLDADPF